MLRYFITASNSSDFFCIMFCVGKPPRMLYQVCIDILRLQGYQITNKLKDEFDNLLSNNDNCTFYNRIRCFIGNSVKTHLIIYVSILISDKRQRSVSLHCQE